MSRKSRQRVQLADQQCQAWRNHAEVNNTRYDVRQTSEKSPVTAAPNTGRVRSAAGHDRRPLRRATSLIASAMRASRQVVIPPYMGASNSSFLGSNRSSRPLCPTSRGWSAVTTTTGEPSMEVTVEVDGALLLLPPPPPKNRRELATDAADDADAAPEPEPVTEEEPSSTATADGKGIPDGVRRCCHSR